MLVKCFNLNVLKTIVGARILSYKLLKSENKPAIEEYVLNKIDEFVNEDYPKETRNQMDISKKRELIDLVSKAASERGIVFDKQKVENKLFGNDEIADSTEQDAEHGTIDVGSIFRSRRSFESDDRKMYGSQIYPRILMKRAFHNIAVRSFFMNMGVVVNPINAPGNIFVEKLKLVNDILNNLPNKNVRYTKNGKIITVQSIQKQVREMKDIMMGIGKDNRKLSLVERIEKLDSFPPIEIDVLEELFMKDSIISVADNTLNRWSVGTDNEKARLRAYNNLFILRNFDALLSNNFKNLVKVSSTVSNTRVEYVDYKLNIDENNVNKNWQNESDDISVFKEAGNVVKAILETMPLYNYNTKQKTDMTLEWNRFNNAIGFLKNLPYTEIAGYEITGTDEYGDTFSYGKIGDLVSSISENPAVNMKRLFDALFNGKVSKRSAIDYIMDRFFDNSEYQRKSTKDAIYSIYQSFYGDKEGLMLYNSLKQNKSNHKTPDYYSFMVQYMNSAYRMQFVYYRRDNNSDTNNIRGFILNDRAMTLTEKRVKSRIYNASRGIQNEFMLTARNNFESMDDSLKRFGQPDISIVKEVDENGNMVDSGVVSFNRIPIGNDLYTIRFDSANSNVLLEYEGSGDSAIKIIDVNNGMKEISVKEFLERIKPSESDMSTVLDDMISIAYSLPVNNDEGFRRILYSNENGSFDNENFDTLFRGAVSIMGLSYLNNEKFSRISDSRELKDAIEESFPKNSKGTASSVSRLIDKPGINNMSSYIGDAISIVLNAISYVDNVLGRDTIASPDGTQISATQPNRLVSSIDSQQRRIKNEKGFSPAKNLLINCNAGEFKQQLIDDGVFTVDDVKELFGNISDSENLFSGSYTTRLAEVNGQVKKRSEFNIQESVISDYVINFLNNVYGKEQDKDIIFNTQVNSDKSQITYESINGKLIRNLANLSEGKRKNVIRSVFRRLYDTIRLAITDVHAKVDEGISGIATLETNSDGTTRGSYIKTVDRYLTNHEIGMMDKFFGVYATDGYIDLPLFDDIRNNFESFNMICDKAGVNAYEMAFLLNKVYNKMNPDEPVNFIDQTNFLKEKGTNHIKFNRLLVSKMIRFNPESKALFDMDKHGGEMFYSNFDRFYKAKNDELFFSMIDNGIDLSITSSVTGRDNGFSGLAALRERDGMKDWFVGDRMVLGRIVTGTNSYVPITNEYDLRIFLENNVYDRGFKDGKQAVINAFKSSKNMNKLMNDLGFSIEVNPELAKFNWIDYFIGQSYEITSVGDNFNHPVKGDPENDMELDAFATYAQIKRNVSQTTTIKPWIVNHLNSIPRVIDVAPIEDIENTVSSFSGMRKRINPHDGIAFMSPTAVYLFNNGLMDSKVGFDMKPFFHDYNIATSTGVIIKCSTDALTNQTIKQGKNTKKMAYKMMGAQWRDVNGNLVTGNIFTDYGFRKFNTDNTRKNLFNYVSNEYHPMVEVSNGMVYEITDVQYEGLNDEGIPVYKRIMRLVDKNGDYTDESPELVDTMAVSSNYDLWMLFGGEHSKQKSNDTGLVEDSENSIKIVVDIMNNNGTAMDGSPIDADGSLNVRSQEDVYQFMKFGNADIVASHGAMKQGYTNANRYQDFYFSRKGLLNTMKFDLTHSGVVLDPTHKADNSTISELTQVVNALSSRGFTKWKSTQIYDALASITLSSMIDLVEKTKGTRETPNYNNLAAHLIVSSMAMSKSFSDKAREDCADLISKVKNGGFVTYDELKQRLDIGSNSFIVGAIPIIASYINSRSIKKENAGTLALMKASSGIVQIFGNRLYGEIGVTDAEKLAYLNRHEASAEKMSNPSQAYMGHIYKIPATAEIANELISRDLFMEVADDVYYTDGYMYFNLKDFKMYDAFKEAFNRIKRADKNITFQETFVRPARMNEEYDLVDGEGSGYVALGRELAPINYHFNMDGVLTNMYDLKVVELMKRVRDKGDVNVGNEISKILLENYGVSTPVEMSNFDKAMMLYQKEMNNLSDAHNNGSGWVSVMDEKGNVSKATATNVDISYYEAVAPNINQTRFGIDKNTNIQDITPEYFAKRFVGRMKLKVDPSHYTYALLKQSGKHIYVYDANIDFSRGFKPDSSMEMVDVDKTPDQAGNIYVYDRSGKKKYKIAPGDVIYRKKDGTEIIVTKDPSYVIGSCGFSGLKISPNIYTDSDVTGNKSVFEDIIVRIFNQASASFEDGRVVEGSGSASAYYWVSENHGHDPYINDVFETAYEEYLAMKNGDDVDVYNNFLYDRIITEINNGRFDRFKDNKESPFRRKMHRDTMSMYESFKMSLKSIVARTPSQTMQSFMPMEIVAFDKGGNNSCYVSDMQVWLQGSDFDGDKTNFQEYAIDSSGHFIGWSPHFDLTRLNQSMRLPFPTGKSIKVIGEYTGDNTQKLYDALFGRVFEINKDGMYVMRKADDVNLSALAGIIDIINKDSENRGEGILRKPTGAKNVQMKFVVDAINNHNTYMNNLDNRLIQGVKNFITYTSLSISEDPANLYESQSSVDDMDDISNLGKKNDVAKERLKISSANFILKYDALVNNIVGKNVISVVASGMKTFFNIVNFYNTLDTDNIGRGLIGRNGEGVSILGKRYSFVANWNPTQKVRDSLKKAITDTGIKIGDNPTNAELAYHISSMLEGTKSEKNAGLILSALLSEATDNAKNLNLAKINANEDMAPFYVYAITIGMDIDDIGAIMMSDTARLYAKLKNGNIFYNEKGPGSVNEFKRNYIEKEYNKKPNTLGFESLSQLSKNILIGSNGRGGIPEFINLYNSSFSSINKDGVTQAISRTCSDLDNILKSAITKLMLTGNNKASDSVTEITNYFNNIKRVMYMRNTVYNDTVQINGTSYSMLDALVELEKGRNEMQLVAKIVGLNKGVKTTRDKQIAFNNAIKGIFDGGGLEESQRKEVDKFLETGRTNPYSKKASFNFDKFIKDPEYRGKAISLYDKYVKHTFNVLDIVYSLNLIRSYIEVSNISTGITEEMSLKNKVVSWISEVAKQDLGRLNQKEEMSMIKHVGMYVNSTIFNNFVKSIGYEFNLPSGYKFYVSNNMDSTLPENTPEHLGTERGNMNFMKWMNEHVIPNMKNGVYDERNPKNRRAVNNRFVNNMSMVPVDRTLSGAPMFVYTPSVDRSSNSSHDVMEMAALESSMRNLDSAVYVDSNGTRHIVSDLLFIYNHIAFSGMNSKYSMDDYFSNWCPVKKRYSRFEESFLDERNIVSLIPYDYEETNYGVLQYLAPDSNTWSSKSRFVRAFNRSTMKTEFYRMNTDRQEEVAYDGQEDGYEHQDVEYSANFDGGNISGDNVDSDIDWMEGATEREYSSGFNSSNYSLIGDAKNEGNNFVSAAESSTSVKASAYMFNMDRIDSSADGIDFDLIDSRTSNDMRPFMDFDFVMNGVRENRISESEAERFNEALLNIITMVNNSDTGVIKLKGLVSKYVMNTADHIIALSESGEGYMFSKDGRFKYIDVNTFSGLGLASMLSLNNFADVKSILEAENENESCAL